MKTTIPIEHIRHSLAHVLAAAVLKFYTGVKLGIGPAIENGFYYDFDLPKPLSAEDLPAIEKEMRRLMKQGLGFAGQEKTIDEARELFHDQPFKLELIRDLKEKGTTDYGEIQSGTQRAGKDHVSVYATGSFMDLCAGGHVDNTQQIDSNAFKLTRVAGAYWRGSEKNKMLTRIYGVAFATKQELEDYLKYMEEVTKRDHRKLGVDLDLFSFHSVAPGAPFWHPNGMIIFKELEKFWREEHAKAGYQETSTPILNKKELWEKSGHWQHYRDNMFIVKQGDETYSVKPMNCPDSTYIYASKLRSYRDLPLRLSEIGRLHRNEVSGALGGLFRVRQITMDDAHIYCRFDQAVQEISGVLKLVTATYKVFGLKPSFTLSTMPAGHLGEASDWKKAEEVLSTALNNNKLEYKVSKGEGAFYGPKVDIVIKDSLNREWQVATIQLDFQLPERFDLHYTDEHGSKARPVIIHRAIYGSFERFIGILLEHTAGNLPVWLSPVQVKLVSVGKAHEKYAEKLAQQMKDEGIRAEADTANETVSYRIRKAEQQKVPYILVIGDKEMKSKQLAVRMRGSKDTKPFTTKKFTDTVKEEIEKKK